MSTTTKPTKRQARLPDEPADEAALAYELARADVTALPADEVGRITAHVPTVASIALGALPNLEAYGEKIAALPDFDLPTLLKLRVYARALLHAHLLTLPSTEAETVLRALLAEAAPLRERLLVSAEALALLDFVDRGRVAAIRSGTGHLDTANDLISLAQLFRAGGDDILGKTRLEEAEVDRAYELGMQLVDALGKRRVGTDGAGAAGEHEEACARLFRLVVRTYDQGRRALTYLRWKEGDVNTLMPSLFTRRPGRAPAPKGPTDGEGPEPLDPADPLVD